jgi:hypothetical protein
MVLELMENMRIYLEPNYFIGEHHSNIVAKYCIHMDHYVISDITLCIGKRT